MAISQNEDDYGNGVGNPKSEKTQNEVSKLIDTWVNTGTLSFKDSAYWPESSLKPYNPDDLVQRNGDYSTYEDMLKDDQVSIALKLKKDLVLASGFDIVCDYDDEYNQQIKKELEAALCEDPEYSIEESLQEILTAYEFGFSLSEKSFKYKEDGKLTLRFIKTRHPSTWLIHTDVYGNVEKFEQRGESNSLYVPKEALIHYINENRFQNPYGISDLRSAYAAWFIKNQIIKYYAIFMEKAASPTPIAKYNKDAPQSAVDDIFNAIKKFQTKTALAIPKDIEVEFLESSNNGDVFQKAINIFNMFIGRSLFIPDLLGFQGGETSGGSYSLGKEQLNVLFKHINRRRQFLEKAINKEIIKPLIVHNYGNIENHPKFKLRPVREEDLIDLAKIWLDGAKSKVFTPNSEEINHFRNLLKFPEGEVIIPEATPQFGSPSKPPMGQGEDELDIKNKEESQTEDDIDISQKSESDTEELTIKEKAKKELESNPQVTLEGYKVKTARPYKSTPGNYAKKVDFKAIEKTMDSFQDRVMKESDPVVKKIFKDLFEQMKRKKIVENQKVEKIDSLKLKYTSELFYVLKKQFQDAYKDAYLTAQRELDKGSKYAQPLLDEDFLKVLEEETWLYIGDWEYLIKRKTKTELIKAIKDGIPLSEVVSVLNSDGAALSEVSLNRYARTKFTEVMNRGRHEYFEESGVVAAYQYSAVLDDRTTEICEGLHGKVFAAGDEPNPPLHFNCRSLLVPITKYEKWDADSKVGSKPIDQFIEDNIGDGFSKQ